MLILRQSTAIDIRMGPFVDVGDGFTPETGVTIGASDQAEVLKANGAATVAMAGAFAAVTGADGWYDYTASTTDLDTVGEVVFVMQDASVYLPVFVRGYVVEEAVYDAMYAASAAGPLQSTTAGRTLDVAATGEAGVDFGNVLGTLDAAEIGADAITAAKLAADAVAEIADAVWDELQSGHVTAGSFGELATEIADILADTNELQADDVPGLIAALNDPTAAAIADAVWDEDIEAAHGTDATAGLLLRVLGAGISNRANNATLDALLGVADTASNDVPNQILDGDTLAELSQGIPAATPTLRAAMMLLYMAMRNEETQSNTTYTVANDARTVIAKSAVADVAGTITKDEMVSGP